MQPEFSKELEEHLVLKYASIRHKFKTALQDQNEYKNLPNLSYGLLALLKNVQKAKPHADYLMQSLESTDIKLRAMNFLLHIKPLNENKTKDSTRVSCKTTLNTQEYFKDKLEKIKAKSNSNFKKPFNGTGTGTEETKDSYSTKNKPLLRSYKNMDEGGNSDYPMVTKKTKLTKDEVEEDSSFKNAVDLDKKKISMETEAKGPIAAVEMPGFTSAKDQYLKNQQQKKKYNDNGNERSGQRGFYKKGYNNKFSKYKKDDEMDEGDPYEDRYKSMTSGKSKFLKTDKNKKRYDYEDGIEEQEKEKEEEDDEEDEEEQDKDEDEESKNSAPKKYQPKNALSINKGSLRSESSLGKLKLSLNESSSNLNSKEKFGLLKKNISTDQSSENSTSTPLKDQTKASENNDIAQPKTLGLRKKFIPPLKENKSTITKSNISNSKQTPTDKNEKVHELKGLDSKLVEMIESEIVDRSPKICWKDIAGLEFAKKTIYEIIVWPMMRPDIFNGLRAPPKGLLLFGPPGTGKTLIGKAIASESNSTFFSISASSLTSKWVGEGEKMVKTLFALAASRQPSVVFIDEIDSLLCSRSEKDEESSRRIKTEFLVQLDGAKTTSEERILIIGATNRPQELDEAVRRRFQKRLYIPLPNIEARKELIKSIIEKDCSKGNKYKLPEEKLNKIANLTKGYSGADIRNLCAEASMIPLRSVNDISEVKSENLRPITTEDFLEALKLVKASVSNKDLGAYLDWNRSFGSFEFKEDELES